MTKSFPGLPGPTTCSSHPPWIGVQHAWCSSPIIPHASRGEKDCAQDPYLRMKLGMGWQLGQTLVFEEHIRNIICSAVRALAAECVHCRHEALISQCDCAACLGSDATVRRPQAALWKPRPILPDYRVELVTYVWTCVVLHFINPLDVRAKAGSSLKIQGQMHP